MAIVEHEPADPATDRRRQERTTARSPRAARTRCPRSPLFEGRFGRMFRSLPAPRHDREALIALGKAMADREAPERRQPQDPVGLHVLRPVRRPRHHVRPAVRAEQVQRPGRADELRSPRFDLDSVYGAGPSGSPFLYEFKKADRRGVRLLEGRNTDDQFERRDLQRNAQGARSSPTRATTRTSSSPSCTTRSSASTTTWSSRSRKRSPASPARRCSPRRGASSPGITSGSSSTTSCRGSSVRSWRRRCCRTPNVPNLKLLRPARGPVHPGRVLRRRLPLRAQPGPAGVRPQRDRRRRAAVLGREDRRPGHPRPPQRLPAAAGRCGRSTGRHFVEIDGSQPQLTPPDRHAAREAAAQAPDLGRRREHRPPGAQPAPRQGAPAAVRAGGRPGHRRRARRQPRAGPLRPVGGAPGGARGRDAALVLRPARGRERPAQRPAARDGRRDGSWARCSSACSRTTRRASCASSRRGSRPGCKAVKAGHFTLGDPAELRHHRAVISVSMTTDRQSVRRAGRGLAAPVDTKSGGPPSSPDARGC